MAQEVKTINGYGIKDAKAVRTYDTVNLMKADTQLDIGQHVKTRGYNSINDGGAKEYYITDTQSLTEYQEILANGLYATLVDNSSKVKLIIPKNFEGNISSGECCLILHNNKSILYDTNRSQALGEVLDYLERYDITKLDYVILSHYHDDHVGNFVSLVNNGYIDENTEIFLPAYSNLIEQSESTLAYYNDVQACITNNNLNARIPTLEEIVNIDDLDVQFFNCDTTLFGTMGVTNYNDCSTIVLLKYGNQTTLLTGDAVDKPFMYFVNNKKLNFKINNYQIEHHGYSMTNNIIPFMQQINPDNAFVFTTMYSLINQNSSVRSTSLSFMSMKNKNIISQGYTEEDTILEIYKNYTDIKGKAIGSNTSYNIINNIYVDPTINDTDYQNGTQMYPYKSIQQALSRINKSQYASNVINLADGAYEFSYHIITSSANITINGNESDKTAVVIKNRLSFYDCVNVILNNLTINVSSSTPLVINNSNAKINNCIIKSSSYYNGLNVDNSNVYLYNNTFDSCNNGLYATDSIINMDTNTFSNNNRGYRFNHTIYTNLAETFTDNVTSDYLVQNSSNITDNNRKVVLLDNYNTVLEADDVVTLNYDITKCTSVSFCFGRITDGTWNTNTVYPFNNTFNVNDTFRVKTLASYIYFKVTDTNKIQAINIYTNAQALRKIIGYLQ